MTTTAAEENLALREQIRLLCAGMNLRYDDPTAVVPSTVVDLARGQHPVRAIKALREATGAGLVEAKRIVDAVET